MSPASAVQPDAGRTEIARRAWGRVERTPLRQLLHALNQPLTGLQCSLEVALAVPRTAEHYARTLRECLELAGRMRALGGAIHEVVLTAEQTAAEGTESIDAAACLEQVLLELSPVGRERGIAIVREFPAGCAGRLQCPRSLLLPATFRLLESALALADSGGSLLVSTGFAIGTLSIRVQWNSSYVWGSFSAAELGLLVAQACWERAGATWDLERDQGLPAITVRLPGAGANSGE